MKVKRSRYQHGSIRRVERANGYAWEVRFSEWTNGKRHQRTQLFDGARYPREQDVRQAIELTVSKINAAAGAASADAKFMDVCNLYRNEHLPTLEHSTRCTNEYVLTRYIEARFGHTPIREVKPLAINTWIQGLRLSPTTKATIRSVMSVCFRLAALHELIPPMQQNPMSLIKLKGVTRRQKRIPQITVEDFKKLLAKLPEPLNVMVLVTGALGLRISETLALQWQDIDAAAGTISIRRKFTRGQVGNTKTAASEAPLPLARPLLEALLAYKPRTGDSEWIFPSTRNGKPRSASMLLQKQLKPAAEKIGLGRITWHSLRHACRSWLSSGGAAIGTQKDLLRHSNVSTTLDVYGAALTEDMRRAHSSLVDKLLG